MNMSNNKRRFNPVYLITLAGNFLSLAGDASSSWPSPSLPKLMSNDTSINPLTIPITSDEQSWLGSLNSMGAMLGLYPMALLSDTIGRKPTLLLVAFQHLTAFCLLAFSANIHWYYVARFLNGVAVSAGYVIIPMYIAEISESSYRGRLLASFSVFAAFGTFQCYIVGPYLSILWFDLYLAVFPIIFIFIFTVMAPESPYFYVVKEDYRKAKRVILQLRDINSKNLDRELMEIAMEIEKTKTNKGQLLRNFKQRAVAKGALITVILSTLQQFSGIAAFQAYTQLIFQEAGTVLSPELSSIVVGGVFFGASIFCPLLIDKKGRRFLLICSISGVICSHLMLGSFYYFKQNDFDMKMVTWLPIFSLVFAMFMYNIGFGPLPLIITSETLPANVKFLIATVAGICASLATFSVTKFFNVFNEELGKVATSGLFSVICAMALCFVVFYVPETKGKTFQEIQEILAL